MLPRTDFHCITTCCMFFWVKFFNAFVYFVIQYKYLETQYILIARQLKLSLIVPGRQGKYIFTQGSFYLESILNDINYIFS